MLERIRNIIRTLNEGEKSQASRVRGNQLWEEYKTGNLLWNDIPGAVIAAETEGLDPDEIVCQFRLRVLLSFPTDPTDLNAYSG